MRHVILAFLVCLTGSCMMHQACTPAHDLGADLQRVDYRAAGWNFKVYRIGEGPTVILLHELPGMTGEDIRLARMIAKEHFTVYLPLFFGDPGHSAAGRNLIVSSLDGDFHPFARHEASPAVEWVRGFGNWLAQSRPGIKIGIVGMCLTGNFAVPLARESWFGAGVMSQPALPTYSSALGVSDDDLRRVPANSALLYFRFIGDTKSPHAKLVAFKTALPLVETYEIAATCRHRTHSVLAEDYVATDGTEAAFNRMIEVFHERLR